MADLRVQSSHPHSVSSSRCLERVGESSCNITALENGISVYDADSDINVNALLMASTYTGKTSNLNTWEEDINRLVDAAKKNNQTCIELLINIAMGENIELSIFVQNKLFELVTSNQEHVAAEAASMIRSDYQKIMNGYGDCIRNSNIKPDADPVILLIAGAKLGSGGGEEDLGTQAARNNIRKYNDEAQEKPLWWTRARVNNGVITLLNTEDFLKLRSKVKCHEVAGDGACQFRAYLALKEKSEEWLKNAPLTDVLNKIKEDKTKIIQAIKDSFNTFKELDQYSNDVPLNLQAIIGSSDFPDQLYHSALTGDNAFLYSVHGIEKAVKDNHEQINIQEDGTVRVALETWLDLMADYINKKLNISTKPPENSETFGYAVCKDNHYNIITTPDFFGGTDSVSLDD